MAHLLMNRLLICLAVLTQLTHPARAEQAPASEAADAPLDAGERSRTVEALADALASLYVDPATGARYAAALRTALARGAYEAIAEQEEFGRRLVADLQAVRPDPHLRLLPNAAVAHPPEPDASESETGLPEGIEAMTMIGDGGDVAYLRFTAFPHDPRTAPAARAFLLAQAGKARAVVIDARPLPGGGIEVMDAILPLFYAEPTLLLSLETRAAGDSLSPFTDGPTLVRRNGRDGYVTRDHVVTPDQAEMRLRHVPLYYLTSARTASAGEHLALAFRRTGRATLIGETTRGAGHYVALAPVGDRFTALVPVGRSFDPDNGRDWEGVGVTPHVVVPADRALEEALRRID
jgi:hypothetical protein